MQKQHKTGNFIQKLQNLLESQTYSDVIAWDSHKTSIDVLDVKRMETEIIPKYFRHQKFESFVRQLNLYGFRKIKLQGRHRFTHPLLLNGEQLTAITSFKCVKSTKGSKETVESPVEIQNAPQEVENRQIHLNSIENGRQQRLLNERGQTIVRNDLSGMPKGAGSTIFMIPANYFNFWNYMQLMGGQNMLNLAPVGPIVPPQ